jgi:uroporphyrinogen decarboxylase
MAGLSVEEYAHTTGVSAVGLDTAMDMARVAPLIPAKVAIQGNLDPLVLVAGGDAMAAETHAILAAMRDRPFIFNLGHGIVPQTPPDHVAALIEMVRAP